MNESKAGRDDLDLALLRRFIKGEEQAFEELVEQYSEELARFIQGFVGDEYEARHLMIESFANLAVSASRFKGRSSLKTYLFAIAKNLSRQHIKSRGREQHIPFEEVIGTLADGGESLDTVLLRKEQRLALHEAMRDMKEDYRSVLLHLYWQDMSYREAGKAMGKSEKQIKDLAYRAKAALKKRLSGD